MNASPEEQSISLREWLERVLAERDRLYGMRFEEAKQATNAAFAASEKAIAKAEIAAEKRFESVNEFRSVLTSQQGTFVARSEVLSLLKAMEEKIELQRLAHEKSLDKMAHLLSIDAYEARHAELQRQVNDLRESRSAETGRFKGMHAMWGYIVAIASIAAVLISHYIK